MMNCKRMICFLLTLALLAGMVPPVSVTALEGEETPALATEATILPSETEKEPSAPEETAEATPETEVPSAPAESAEESAEPETQAESVPATVDETEPVSETFLPEVTVEAADSVTASGTCGTGVTWSLSDEGVLTISGSGAMTNYTADSTAPWYSECASILEVVIEPGVTGIGSYAFYKCQYVQNVSIPDGLVSIGSRAFMNCYDLDYLYVPASVTELSADAKTNGPFYASGYELQVFFGAEEVQPDWGPYWNYKTIEHFINAELGHTPESYEYWMNLDKTVTSITVPDGITRVPAYAFEYETALKTVILPEGVVSIGDYAFEGCTALTRVDVPDSVTYIGGGAFLDCDNLVVRYGGTMVQWGRMTIAKAICSDGTIIDIDATVALKWFIDSTYNLTIIGDGDMSDYDYTTSMPWSDYTSYITSITILDNLTKIGTRAFWGCSKLTSVTIPETVLQINDYAFSNCTALKSVTIPRSVSYIGLEVFYNDKALKEITFRHGVNDPLILDAGAFVLPSGTVSTTVKVPVKTEINPAISGYDWKSDGRTVTYKSHNCVDGHYVAYENKVEPTCTQAGSTGRAYCEACGTTISEASEIPALGHVELTLEGYLPTCTETGLSEGSSCSRCEETLVAQVMIPALGHEAVTEAAVDATCTGSGLTEGSHCSRCGAILVVQEVIDALGHDLVVVPAVEATCSANGLTEGEKCSRCDYVSVAQQIVEKLPHTEAFTEAVAPTCTETGLTEGCVCTVCGETISGRVIVAALGHTEVPIGERVEPTCTTTGMTEGSRCTVCGAVVAAQEEIPTLDHSYKDYVCTVCGYMDRIASGTCGTNVTWLLRSDNTLLISGTGPMTNYSYSSCPWKSYRSQIKMALIGEGVTSIGDYAFRDCTGLTSVTIPDSVTSIGDDAFNDCAGLTNVTIPDSVTSIGDDAFYRCTGLTSVTIGSGVTSIGSSAFYDCRGLTSVTIGSSVTSIGDDAFYRCTGLTSVTIGSGVTSIGSSAFYNCYGLTEVRISDLAAWCGISFSSYEANPIYYAERLILNGEKITDLVIPDSVTSIGDYAFCCCSSLTSVTIPDSVTSIGRYAFGGCTSLAEVHIHDLTAWCGISYGNSTANPTYFAKVLVLNGEKITDLVIPDSVTSIDDYAFYRCTGLTSVTIPDSVTSIGDKAFHGCTGLTSVTIPDSVTSIGNGTFRGCTGLTSVTIPDSVTSIGYDAFYNCTGLTSVTIGSGVTTIGSSAFYNCSGLTSVTIPDSVISIGDSAFHGCNSLTSVTISDSVTTIDLWAFNGCPALESVYFRGSAPNKNANAFSEGEETLNLYYRAGDPSWTKDKLLNYTGKIRWTAVKPSNIRLYNGDGKDCTGMTLWLDRETAVEPMVFSLSAMPAELYGGRDDNHWDYAGHPWVTENGDGTVTVTPTGEAGTVVLKAGLANDSTTVSVTLRFVSLAPDREALPGENPADRNLLSGKTAQLSLVNADTGEPFAANLLTWSMDEIYAPYAKIDAKGKITAKKVVEKVRVEAVASVIGSESTTVTMTVDIFPAVSSVELLAGEKTVNGKTLSVDSSAEPLVLTANLYPLDAMPGVTWTISDKKEAFASYEIADNILTITPKADAKAGSVTIKATSNDGSKKTATVKLQFAAYAKTVTIDKSVTDLYAGDKAIQLSATMEPNLVTKSGIVWSLKNGADKAYVNLSSSGKITPKNVLAPVEVTIVATSKDGMAKDEHTIRVWPKSESQLVIKSGDIYVTKTTQILDVNTQESITLAAYTYGQEEMTSVDWTPLTNKAAEITVNEEGSLTVKMTAAGSVNVTAKTADGRKATVTIKGVKLADSVLISQKKTNITEGLEVASGKSLDLQATVTNAASKKVTWSIEEGSAYAAISSSGKLTAAKDLTAMGKVVVKATADGGAYDEMEVIVRPIAQGVQVYSEAGGHMLFSFRTTNWWVRSNTTLNWDLSTQADTIAMYARVYPFYGDDNARNAIQDVTWKSSAPKIAEFVEDEEGNVSLKLHKTGSATITVTAADGSGQKVTFKLNVVKTVTSLTIADQTVASGKSLNLAKLITIAPTDATNKKLTWEITKGGAYATVSSSGSFKAKKVTARKTVEVTVSSQDGGASTTFCVTITP